MLAKVFAYLAEHKEGIAALVAVAGLVTPVLSWLNRAGARRRAWQNLTFERRQLEVAKLRCEVSKLRAELAAPAEVSMPAPANIALGPTLWTRFLSIVGRIPLPKHDETWAAFRARALASSGLIRGLALTAQWVAVFLAVFSLAVAVGGAFALPRAQFSITQTIAFSGASVLVAWFYAGIAAEISEWRSGAAA